VKCGNPGKLLNEVLYDLIIKSLNFITRSIGRVTNLYYQEGFRANCFSDKSGGKITEKANAKINLLDTLILGIHRDKLYLYKQLLTGRLCMQNSVLSRSNTNFISLISGSFSLSTQDSRVSEGGRKLK